ncbi:MAG: gliding motility-associated C-terminal domain-containing protein [Bacteroidota bacterium]
MLLLPSVLSTVRAQPQEGNQWFFGMGVGLNFNEGAEFLMPPTPIRTPEGSASICNAAGELLFFTDGGGRTIAGQQAPGNIWNRDGASFYNMQGQQGGGWSSTQSSIIVPVPGSTDRYYLFTMDEEEANIDGTPSRGLSLFEVDMRINGGLGGVVDYREAIVPSAIEGLTACRHANGRDSWLACYHPDWDSYDIYHISASGVQLEKRLPRPNLPGARGNAAPLRFSPDAQYFYAPGILFRFDPTSGQLSNPQAVPHPRSYGASFSPNSQYLYLYGTGDFNQQSIVRVSTDVSDVASSEELLFEIDGEFVLPGQLQVAPDGNIYFLEVRYEASFLSAILCANSASPCLRRDLLAFDSPNLFTAGLPNFTDHFFKNDAEDPEIPVTIRASGPVLCTGQSLELEALAGPTARFEWSTGEEGPRIQIDQPGTYTVTVTNDCCSSGSAEISIFESDGTLDLSISGDTLICEDERTVLTAVAPEAQHYRWSTGEKTPNIVVAKSGIYAVTVTNDCGEISVEQIEISFREDQVPSFVPLVTDAPCYGESGGAIRLGFAPQSDAYELTWIDAGGNYLSGASELDNLPAGNYELLMNRSQRGCEFRYQYEIKEPEPLQILSQVEAFDCDGGETTQVSLIVRGGVPDYRFSMDGGQSYTSSGTFQLGEGRYVPRVIDANLCELAGQGIELVAPPPFRFGLDGPTEAVALAEDFSLEAWSNRSFTGATIEWTPREPLSCSDCPDPYASITESTEFVVRVRFADGCVGEERLLVRADKTRRVYVPNAFSPNRDGQNETLEVYTGEGVAGVAQLKVFDRWGALVHDQPTAWDGRLKGRFMPSGIYTWLAEVQFVDGERELYRGDVLLVR